MKKNTLFYLNIFQQSAYEQFSSFFNVLSIFGRQFVFDRCYIICLIYIRTWGNGDQNQSLLILLAQIKPVKITVLLGENIIGNGTYQARNATIRRYICHSCGKAFCDSTNTFYYNLRKDESTI